MTAVSHSLKIGGYREYSALFTYVVCNNNSDFFAGYWFCRLFV